MGLENAADEYKPATRLHKNYRWRSATSTAEFGLAAGSNYATSPTLRHFITGATGAARLAGFSPACDRRPSLVYSQRHGGRTCTRHFRQMAAAASIRSGVNQSVALLAGSGEDRHVHHPVWDQTSG